MRGGGALAAISAATFGATTPFVQRFGYGVGAFTTASALYAGASIFALAALVARRRGWLTGNGQPSPPMRERQAGALRATDVPRLGVVALLGAVVAPVALVWGLQRTSGVTASLLLNFEAAFTVLLAFAMWREPMGPRVVLALLTMTAGGALLVATVSGFDRGTWCGALAVVAATLAWAADNTVGRPLADRDPFRVIVAKGSAGALASSGLALAFGESWPSKGAISTIASLSACGAMGYGASLAFYLRAQRAIGAARTGSIFAVAPFVGAVVARAMGEPAAGVTTVAAAILFAVGLWLHLTESHRHEHVHDAVEHEHEHRHDDDHHHHPHTPPEGDHSHPHRHEATTHAHSHGLDVHHRHRH